MKEYNAPGSGHDLQNTIDSCAFPVAALDSHRLGAHRAPLQLLRPVYNSLERAELQGRIILASDGASTPFELS